jgi:SAM-dependent methyltransferase
MERSTLVALAKRIPPLYWAAGAVRYAQFRSRLKVAENAYRLDPAAPLPPPMLRYRVHRALDEASYLDAGAYVADVIAKNARASGLALEGLRILDFACGPGRVLSQLARRLPGNRFDGSDIDADAIDWARRHLGTVATFAINRPEPPTAYADDSFDIVYSVSLFTHLDEAFQFQWLQEIERILKPGGLLITTTHGKRCLDTCTPAELADLAAKGFVFRVDHTGRFKVDGLPDFYQTTFHSEAYVRRRWGQVIPVDRFVEGGVNNHQDLVVLRK